jgi:glycosyltransferase involved in cell wall biosynthesis
MRIAYCIRPEYKNGGDGVQVMKTKEYLEATNSDYQIDILTTPDDLTCDYNLVHIFNYATSEITSQFFNKAISLGLKIVSSPVFWDYSYSPIPFPQLIRLRKEFMDENYVMKYVKVNEFISSLPSKKLKFIYHNVSREFRKSIRYFIDNSLLILPNSQEEGEKCCVFSRSPEEWKSKIRVVYNGVDIKNVQILDENTFFERYKIPKNYVLQVGRIEYLKNNLNLVGALMDHPEIPIVFLGSDKGTEKYANHVRSVAEKRGNVYFISNVPHDEVYSFYRYAKTHVLLSLRESPGLVSLEALSQKCPIVVSDERFCPVKTYFDEQCEVVNPLDKSSIEKAVLRSLEKEHKTVDLSKFSWEVVAQQTLNAYNEILR